MNKRRLNALANRLEQQRFPKDFAFNMNYELANDGADFKSALCGYHGGKKVKDWCGTVGCIAGTTVVLWGVVDTNTYSFNIPKSAANLLGLGFRDADALFYPHLDTGYDRVTPKQAAKVVRHLAKTGEVDWSVAKLPMKH